MKKFNLKEFPFSSDEEPLYPLASDYLENNSKDHSETIKNAYRMNMPNEHIVTLNQKVTKYLAIPAINTNNNKLQVQFTKDKKVVDINFTRTKKEIEKTIFVEAFEFNSAIAPDVIIEPTSSLVSIMM